MNFDPNALQQQAVTLLQDACCSSGIRSSPDDEETQHEIRTRDAMIAGIAGMLAGDDKVIQGLRSSLVTLVNNQHSRGIIPARVVVDDSDAKPNYGRMAGRVDVQSWFVIGSCLYLLNHADGTLIQKFQSRLNRVFNLLDHWEYNTGGLIYTPTGGNWADEYPIQGHTLYDNLLRLWALKLYNNLFEDERRKKQERLIEETIAVNFWPKTSDPDRPGIYHPRSFKEMADAELDHFACAIHPGGYDTRFDAAGNGLALILKMASNRQYEQILEHLKPIFRQVSTVLLPAFWPVITSDDVRWNTLKNNFNGTFKNYPHQYQNGGIWPVWMGLFALGTNVTGNSDLPETMLRAWMKIENKEKVSFCEYISSDTLKKNGTHQLCSSAAGLIFLITAIKKESLEKLHLK